MREERAVMLADDGGPCLNLGFWGGKQLRIPIMMETGGWKSSSVGVVVFGQVPVCCRRFAWVAPG